MTKSSIFICFVNGRKVEDDVVDPLWSLAWYLRNKLRLTGTKIGCNEGGCGACTVMISDCDQHGKIRLIVFTRSRHYSVNACLTPVLSVHGLAVTTVEGIGTAAQPHAIQERLSAFHGSQCGFCTPGFVMAMYTLLRNKPQPTKRDVNLAIQGNLCRCTGYRPILEAFHTFAGNKDVTSHSGARPVDNDNNSGGTCCGKSEGMCCKTNRAERSSISACISQFKPYDATQEPIFPSELMIMKKELAFSQPLIVTHNSIQWIDCRSLDQLLSLTKEHPHAKLVFGNTEIGLEQRQRGFRYPVLLNYRNVHELRTIDKNDDSITIGSGWSLAEMNEILLDASDHLTETQSQVVRAVLKMLHWFAGIHVRNMATFAGNIATSSPISDLSQIWLASAAELTLRSQNAIRLVKMDEKFFTGYRKNIIQPGEIIASIRIPFLTEDEHFQSYKQAQRREDDIATVNAAFWLKRERNSSKIENIRIAFGGMAPTTKMATKTCDMLIGRQWDDQTLDLAMNSLATEMYLSPGVPGGQEKYRLSLCLSFFLKFYNEVSASVSNREEGGDLEISHDFEHDFTGTQIFQVSGEAKYCDDVAVADCLHMSFVLSEKAHAGFELDTSVARVHAGVVDLLTYEDLLVRKGGFTKYGAAQPETLVFAKDEVVFNGQPIAAVIAHTVDAANEAVRLIKVTYKNIQTPIVTIEQAITARSFHGDKPLTVTNIDDGETLPQTAFSVTGESRIGGQEHFYLEPQCCICIPGERDHVTVIASTQAPSDVQKDVSGVLGVHRNKVIVQSKRIGGGFGGKESAASILAVPCALAATKLRRPVRCVLERYDDMCMTGTRHATLAKWTLAADKDGRLQSYVVDYYANSGHSYDLSVGVVMRTLTHAENAYSVKKVRARGFLCKTNVQSATAFRGFGAPQAMFTIECAIEALANQMGIQSSELRLRNLSQAGQETYYGMPMEICNMQRCWDECRQLANYESLQAQVTKFNSEHTHLKRGLSLTPTKFGCAFGVRCLNQGGALVHIYTDGSVLISHGGIEMGQGLYTKVAQVASAVLGIDMSWIHIEKTSTEMVPNTSATAASFGSDLNCGAVKNACEKLMERLAPLRKDNPEADWVQLVQKAYGSMISLSATGFQLLDVESLDLFSGKPQKARIWRYFTYGCGATMVEVDTLTGDHKVLSTNLVMDIGDSLNPAIDIGQIEGAFTQGYGLTTLEELKCRPTGQWLTRGPSNYKIPSADDCPRDFNVKLLKGSSNKNSIFASKAVGEPPLFLGASVFFAIQNAVQAKTGNRTQMLESPATAERIRNACDDTILQKVSKQMEKDKKEKGNAADPTAWVVSL